jgi:maleate isomerase
MNGRVPLSCSELDPPQEQSMTDAIRLGVIVPSVNIVVEEWYPRVVPDGVSVHFARMLIAGGSSPEKIIAMDREDGMRAIGQIASSRPHAIAYGCTASSIVQGHAFDKQLRSEIRRIAGVPATTATASIFAACRVLGLRRVTVISPYTEAVDAAEQRFFAEGGIETVTAAYLGIADGFRLAEPEPDAILDLALGAWDRQSDGLIAACLNFRSHPMIDVLEAKIGKPVVTSTQAVLWHLLRLAGVATPIPGFGRLLREH